MVDGRSPSIIKPQGARAKLGLLTNKEDTIPGPVDSIGVPKRYILGKRILGTQGFFY